MGLIIVLVFLGVFAVVALLLIASSAGPRKQAKEVQATLDSALATESPETRDADPEPSQGANSSAAFPG